MFRVYCTSLLLFLSFTSFAFYEQVVDIPQPAQVLEDIFLLGKNNINLRLRYEHVQNNAYAQFRHYPLHFGDGLTLSSKLHFQTARFYECFFDLEFDQVTSLLPAHFNSGLGTTPSKIVYAQIPDPKGTAFTQGHIGFLGFTDSLILLGRQIILLDNQRFVGSDAFRQTPQTFDAITLVNRTLKNVEIVYSYVTQVNSIWQGNSLAEYGKRQNQDHLLNVSSELIPFGTVVGYAYIINDDAMPLNSSATFGLRYLDDYQIYDLNLYFIAEYAHQQDHHNQPIPFHAFYTHFKTGLKGFGADLSIVQETLSGNRAHNKAFRTPLASLHQFNGLADQFVSTPYLGLSDWYGQCSLNYFDILFEAQYHHFNSQKSKITYGHEWDFTLSRPFLRYYFIELGFADFSGRKNNHSSDVQKFWITLGARFP